MSKSVVLLLVLVLLVATRVISVKPAWAAKGSWASMAPMPTARRDVGLAVVNGKIYAIGGWNGNYVAENEEYDPATNTWTTKAPMPTPRFGFAIFVYENKIHVVGGYVNGKQPTSAHEVYDPETNIWETKESASNLLAYREAYDTHVVNGKVYIMGGQRSPFRPWPSTNENTVYDPATDTWASGASMPVGAASYASAVVGNKIFVIGGRNYDYSPSTFNLTQVYDTETDTWSYGASMFAPAKQIEGGATTGIYAPKRIYVFGGLTLQDGESISTYITRVYNPETDSWSTGSSMPTQRRFFNVAVVNDKLYVIGGQFATENNESYVYKAENEQYTPIGYGTPDPSYVPPDSTAPEVSVLSPANKTYYTTDIQLNLIVNEPDLWMRYKLDAETVGEITGNTTLTGLSYGAHNLTVYATDDSGNTGTSETIYFTIAEPEPEPFPTTLVVAASVATVVLVSAGLLVYFKKRKR
jgi:N-acetylneuraminic acid mutarotase